MRLRLQTTKNFHGIRHRFQEGAPLSEKKENLCDQCIAHLLKQTRIIRPLLDSSSIKLNRPTWVLTLRIQEMGGNISLFQPSALLQEMFQFEPAQAVGLFVSGPGSKMCMQDGMVQGCTQGIAVQDNAQFFGSCSRTEEHPR